MPPRRIVAAFAVAIGAFLLYRATLLPGLEFGDSGSFQTMAGERQITPRDGYPLYFAIGDLVLAATGGEPAHALNLASAIEGALAGGVIVLVASELAGALLPAVAAALMFLPSYTFWSQSIIAEVYALHILFVGLTLLLLLRWAGRPSVPALALFMAVFALGFGNHLSMVLLLPGYTLFLLLSTPGGWREMLRPRIVLLAAAIAAAGALQYAWNLRALWLWPNHPAGLADALHRFWFDVTKTDWRETMILQVPHAMVSDRAAMYAFDVRQQFGWAIVLAPVGLVALFASNWRRAVLMLTLFAANFAFAFTYEVGDTHVFYLPSHLMLALLFAPAIAWIADVFGVRRAGAAVVVASLLLAANGVARAYDNFPALDRSSDHRPAALLAALSSGLTDRDAILLTDLNWQVQNGLPYFGKVVRPDLAYARLAEVLLYLPAVAADNAAVGREVALTARAAGIVSAAYGPLMPIERDARVVPQRLQDVTSALPPGTRYVLCVLKPTRDHAIDAQVLRESLSTLTGGRIESMPAGDYAVVAGAVGDEPSLAAGGDTPFRRSARVGGTTVDVRMESWLADDTIRRMGFAQVVAGRRHTLIVERGISFAAFDAGGSPIRTAYAAGIFASEPRYLIQGR